ncbi:unnamed protein product [Ostreobium quekettii]|uniref:Endoplasmic reticulum oxidoreductin 1 n=1 Tax=Ostreobium quekettii TaxID=121088 RepID=A0A8S1IMH8_9CHLO|nr:unnamed protein product [Ostreobium quekettii]|eukprot:evm.model.scf_356.6 EVM.evm.TU.scf_356.6   scf_356:75879-79700(-)
MLGRSAAAGILCAVLAVSLGGLWYRDGIRSSLIDQDLGFWTSLVPFVASNASNCSCQADGDAEQGVGSCRLRGTVNDCCCDYETVNRVNQEHLHPVVSELVKTAYFRYFKVNLNCDCPLWPDEGMCSMETCSVCECEDGEVPEPWTEAERKHPLGCNTTVIQNEFQVDKTVDPNVKELLVNLPGWRGFNNPWMAEDEKETEYFYINLLANPERFTGYKGEHTQRVWKAVYSQSCFTGSTNPGEDECTEKRIFYRLISGLHSSITAHIAKEYLIDEERGIWGPNLDLFYWGLGRPELKSRVENLYFAFLFVLRAAMKTGPLLDRTEYNTGLPEEDKRAQELMHLLANHPSLQQACPVPFDEGRLWKGDEGPDLKATLMTSFRNITRIMDCVGCEKCKLWGKVQTLGLATALKILFHESDCGSSGSNDTAPLILERNEIISLVNLLERLSQSVETYRVLSAKLEEREKGSARVDAAAAT